MLSLEQHLAALSIGEIPGVALLDWAVLNISASLLVTGKWASSAHFFFAITWI
jgi:hypothetical protein